MLDVINDILDMSKIEAGGIRLILEDVDLSPVLAECLRVVSGPADEKHITLKADITPAICLRADRRALKQIALNLLSNAVKFTPEGGSVTLTGHTRGGMSRSLLKITASVLPRTHCAKLGRPFEQVESQLTKQHQGSGLGLAIAKSLVELHGGAMRIGSTLGKGTLVVVRLPVEAREAVRRRHKARAHANLTAPCPESARNTHAPAAGSPRHELAARRNPAGRRRAPTE